MKQADNNYTMKDLPEEERPYERLMHKGASSLSDAELLSIILRNGRFQETALDMSRRILREASLQSEEGTALAMLLNLSPEELMRFPGIGKVKALQLKAVLELSSRLSTKDILEYDQVTGANSIAERYIPTMRYLQKEEIHGLWLDNRLRILGETVLSVGSINQALLSSREIFLEALRYKAVYFILIHNHPSGDPTPSSADISGTHRILEASRILEIALMDHIIIGNGVFFSMKEEGLL